MANYGTHKYHHTALHQESASPIPAGKTHPFQLAIE
jgi:hypothetical protein